MSRFTLPRMQLPPRLESLVAKNGLHLGVLSDADRVLVLALAACAIEPAQSLREHQVNGRLIHWLADVGQMLRTDHVELRRWLVDTGFVVRDDWGHAYVRGRTEVDRARQVLGTTDGAALASAVRSARVAAQSVRLARRGAFESRRPQDDFIARGSRAAEKARRTCIDHDAPKAHGELQRRLEARRRQVLGGPDEANGEAS